MDRTDVDKRHLLSRSPQHLYHTLATRSHPDVNGESDSHSVEDEPSPRRKLPLDDKEGSQQLMEDEDVATMPPSGVSTDEYYDSTSFTAEKGLKGISPRGQQKMRLSGHQERKPLWSRMKSAFTFENIRKNWKAPFFAAALLFTAVGSSLYFKRMTAHMTNYPYFLSLLTTAVYIPVFAFIALYDMKFTDFITPEMRQFPKRKFFVIGALDSFAVLLMIYGGVHTSGASQALLLNFLIPVSLILVRVLSSRLTPKQYWSAVLIVGGVLVTCLPNLIANNKQGDIPLFSLVFLLSTIPQGISSMYKEAAFFDFDIDVNYLQAWVAVFQFLVLLVLLPVSAIPYLNDSPASFHSLFSQISNGFMCLTGQNAIQTQCSVTITRSSYDFYHVLQPKCDACQDAWLPVFLYIILASSYNLIIMYVVRMTGPTLVATVMTARIPLTVFAFALPITQSGYNDAVFDWTTMVGMIIITVGLSIYRWPSSHAPYDEGDLQNEEELEGGSVLSEPIGYPDNGVDYPPSTPQPAYVKATSPMAANPAIRRDGTVIRGNFYAQIGVIDSPGLRSNVPLPSQPSSSFAVPSIAAVSSSILYADYHYNNAPPPANTAASHPPNVHGHSHNININSDRTVSPYSELRGSPVTDPILIKATPPSRSRISM